jgi:SPP1 family predicted phage head-tail adaptor
MRAGRLNKRATFQSRSTAQTTNGPGDQSTVWTNVLSAWVELMEMRMGREVIAQGGDRDVGDYEVSMRYREEIRPEMRMRIGDRYFSIVGTVRNIGQRNRELRFNVTENLDQTESA